MFGPAMHVEDAIARIEDLAQEVEHSTGEGRRQAYAQLLEAVKITQLFCARPEDEGNGIKTLDERLSVAKERAARAMPNKHQCTVYNVMVLFLYLLLGGAIAASILLLGSLKLNPSDYNTPTEVGLLALFFLSSVLLPVFLDRHRATPLSQPSWKEVGMCLGLIYIVPIIGLIPHQVRDFVLLRPPLFFGALTMSIMIEWLIRRRYGKDPGKAQKILLVQLLWLLAFVFVFYPNIIPIPHAYLLSVAILFLYIILRKRLRA